MSFTKHFALYISQYAFHIMNFTVCISQFAFHSMHLTVCISQYKFHIMHFTVCISQCAILVYSWTILVNFSAKKVYFNFFRFCPIVKSVISLYKLNTRCAGLRELQSFNLGFIHCIFRFNNGRCWNDPEAGNASKSPRRLCYWHPRAT